MGKKREDYELPGRSEWLRADYTRNYSRAIKHELEQTEMDLMGAARLSADPLVARTYEKHMAAKRQWELFTRQGKNDDDAF